jgi:hypothetical protein
MHDLGYKIPYRKYRFLGIKYLTGNTGSWEENILPEIWILGGVELFQEIFHLLLLLNQFSFVPTTK